MPVAGEIFEAEVLPADAQEEEPEPEKLPRIDGKASAKTYTCGMGAAAMSYVIYVLLSCGGA